MDGQTQLLCPAWGCPQSIGGLGEGNKGANLAEVPIKDGSGVALCAFVLLVTREKKSIFYNYFLCVQPSLCFSYLGAGVDTVKQSHRVDFNQYIHNVWPEFSVLNQGWI